MSERMTIAEIETRFPDEWIFVTDPETAPDLSILSGVVAAHSKDRDEIYRVGKALKPRRSAVWFNGEPPEDVILIPTIFGSPDDCRIGDVG